MHRSGNSRIRRLLPPGDCRRWALPAMSVRIYYLEQPLSNEDVQFVAAELGGGEEIEQVKIPYVLPVLSDEGLSMEDHRKHEDLLRKHLRSVGIGRDRNNQVILVAPCSMHWYSALSGAVEAETAQYPWLVQTTSQREAIGNPGETRILDMEGLFGRKD